MHSFLQNPCIISKTHVPKFFFGLIIALSQIGNLHGNSLEKTGNTGHPVLDQCNCFTRGTLVLVAPHTDGAFLRNGKHYKEIQDIRGGDTVIAWNEKTGQLTYSKVQETFVRETDAIYRITYEDGTIVETTWSHPFYIAGIGWVKGKDLRPGMQSPTPVAIAAFNERLAMSGGMRLPVMTVAYNNAQTGRREMSVRLSGDLPFAVTIVKTERIAGGETVYNFSVQDAHDYFVSEQGVLVHNDKYSMLKPIGGGDTKARIVQDDRVLLAGNDKYATLRSLAIDQLAKEGKTVSEENVASKQQEIRNLNPDLFKEGDTLQPGDDVIVSQKSYTNHGSILDDAPGVGPVGFQFIPNIVSWGRLLSLGGFIQYFISTKVDAADQNPGDPSGKTDVAEMLSRNRSVILNDVRNILESNGMHVPTDAENRTDQQRQIDENDADSLNLKPLYRIFPNSKGYIVIEDTASGRKIVTDRKAAEYYRYE